MGASPGGRGPLCAQASGALFVLNDLYWKVLRKYLRKLSFWAGIPSLGTQAPSPPLARLVLAGRAAACRTATGRGGFGLMPALSPVLLG